MILIIGCFIFFGVCNVFFFIVGLGKMNVWKFVFSDFFVCIILCVIFFYFYYIFGELVIEIVKKGNIVIFLVFFLVGFGYFIRKKKVESKVN